MAYELVYRMLFENFQQQEVIVHISDTTSGQINPTTFLDMVDPVSGKTLLQNIELKTVSDNDSKTGIKSLRCEVTFRKAALYNVSTFVNGEDNRWLMEVFIANTSNPIFKGYLITDDNTEGFLADGVTSITLTASDNLGVLRDVPLTKDDGTVPRGYFKVIEYISWILKKTNLELTIRVAYNLFEENYNGASHASFDKTYLHAKTFETGIRECENCHAALEKLIKGCFVTQVNGEWWIVRADEMNTSQLRYYTFDPDGTFTGVATVEKLKYIGRDETMMLRDKDAQVGLARQHKYDKQTFPLNLPIEIIDNIDFARGDDWISLINLGSLAAAYVIEDWTLERDSGAVQINAYIRKEYEDTLWTYERERFVVLTSGASSQHWIKSNPVYLHQYDKFDFSIDRRLSANQGGSGTITEFFAQIRLVADDGTFYTLTSEASGSEPAGGWVACNSTFTTNQRYVKLQYERDQVNEAEEWLNASVEAKPLPKDGNVYILLLNSSVYGTPTTVDTHFSNLQFDYKPYINGGYPRYTGRYHKVSIDENRLANIEEDVFISDSPKKLFKGGLHIFDGTNYVLAGNWYNYNAGTTGELGEEKFGKYQVFELWNQNNRVFRKLQGSLLYLDMDQPTNLPHLIHRFEFTVQTSHTTDKTYMLLSFTQNLVTCRWSGVFGECFDQIIGKSYDDDHEFKYIS